MWLSFFILFRLSPWANALCWGLIDRIRYNTRWMYWKKVCLPIWALTQHSRVLLDPQHGADTRKPLLDRWSPQHFVIFVCYFITPNVCKQLSWDVKINILFIESITLKNVGPYCQKQLKLPILYHFVKIISSLLQNLNTILKLIY